MSVKICSKCNEAKDFIHFHIKSDKKDKLTNICKICTSEKDKLRYILNSEKIKAKQRAYSKIPSNKEKAKDYQLNRYYGINLSTYTKIFNTQKGLCAICKQPGKHKDLAVDHDHTTGEVRGLLHRTCNSALGLFKDDFKILINAAKYIQEFQGVI